jgi:hypothetical protein
VRSAIIFLNDFAVLAFIVGELIFSYYTKGNRISPPSATMATSATLATKVHAVQEPKPSVVKEPISTSTAQGVGGF